MARFAKFLGRRVEVLYRAGDVVLPAAGTLAADSGRSIFLEECFTRQGQVKTFRWEIPYHCILRLDETAAPSLADAAAEHPSADSVLEGAVLRLKHRPHEA